MDGRFEAEGVRREYPISTLKFHSCCTSRHLIRATSMISPVLRFTFATVLYGCHSNSRMVIACSCVLTNCEMLLTFGYVLVALGSACLALKRAVQEVNTEKVLWCFHLFQLVKVYSVVLVIFVLC